MSRQRPPPSQATLNNIGSLAQDSFLKLSKDLGAVTSYKGVTPATPLGLVGFDLGIELTATNLENSGIFKQAGGSSSSSVLVPKLHIHKGLPFGFDIGAFISKVSDANISLIGAGARWVVIDDGIATPAVGLRIAGTKETGVGQIDLSTLSADIVVSKKLTLVTPFVGVGRVQVKRQAQRRRAEGRKVQPVANIRRAERESCRGQCRRGSGETGRCDIAVCQGGVAVLVPHEKRSDQAICP